MSSPLATYLRSINLPDEAEDVEKLQKDHDRLLRWVKTWVLTGEMRLDDDCDEGDEGDEIWEEYAGWLPVHEMPPEVQALRGAS